MRRARRRRLPAVSYRTTRRRRSSNLWRRDISPWSWGALHSGMRRENQFHMRWAHVDFTTGWITAPRSKSGTAYRSRMNDTGGSNPASDAFAAGVPLVTRPSRALPRRRYTSVPKFSNNPERRTVCKQEVFSFLGLGLRPIPTALCCAIGIDDCIATSGGGLCRARAAPRRHRRRWMASSRAATTRTPAEGSRPSHGGDGVRAAPTRLVAARHATAGRAGDSATNARQSARSRGTPRVSVGRTAMRTEIVNLGLDRARRLLSCTALALSVVLLLASSANAADQALTGKKLLLKSTPKVVLISKDASISIAGSDPLGGADSSISFDDGSGPVTFNLPTTLWSTNNSGTSFTYKNADAPGGPSAVKIAKVKPGLLKVDVRGLPFAVPNGAARIAVVLSLDGGTNTYCMTFAGTGDGNKFLVKDAPPADSDGDGTADCLDGCPYNPLKVTPGCGCDTVDYDLDFDGFPWCVDCLDFYPLNRALAAAIHPNHPGEVRVDVPCDGIDIDCSIPGGQGCEPLTAACSPNPCGNVACGSVPDGCGGTIECRADNDGDGFDACVDCNDADPNIHPPFSDPGRIWIDLAPCDGKDSACSIPGGHGCQPLTAACNPCGNLVCGEVSDLCGGTISCGTNGGGCFISTARCVAGQCCTPNLTISCTIGIGFPPVSTRTCGIVSDGCGGTVNLDQRCGACPTGQTCDTANPVDFGGVQYHLCTAGPPCEPNCSGKTCGDADGCGGVCTGGCPSGVCGIHIIDGSRYSGACVPLCSSVECGHCMISSGGGGGLIVVNNKECPTGTTCDGTHHCVGIAVSFPCPQGCAGAEVCNESTGQCECGNTVCDRSLGEYCDFIGGGVACCNFSSLLCTTF